MTIPFHPHCYSNFGLSEERSAVMPANPALDRHPAGTIRFKKQKNLEQLLCSVTFGWP
jgi:hypothetical protein